MKIIKMDFSQFRRNYIFIFSYAALILGSIFFVLKGAVSGAQLPYILLKSQSLSIISFIYFSFITYEFQRMPEEVDLLETLRIIKYARAHVLFSRILLLLLLIVIYTVTPIVTTVFYGGGTVAAQYIEHIVLNNILNIFLVGVLAILFGSILAMKRGRVSAYIIMILVFFLISPFFENIAFAFYILKDINIYPIWDFFHILPYDLDWTPDNFYGLAIEAVRWNLVIFWILLSITALTLLLKMFTSKKKIINVVLVILMVLNLIAYFKPSSVIRYDHRPDGASFGDHIYEIDIASELDGYAEMADFIVLSYNMNFKVRRQLDAEISMVIENMEGNNDYEFTLYRGYEISSITDAEGNNLNYSRNGNYFTINEIFTEDVFTVNVAYSGSGNRYFSNYQGMALLGYAPYYPKAGHLQLWDNGERRITVNAAEIEAKYTVKVDSLGTVYSNLPGADNDFSGTTNGVTLVSGLIGTSDIAEKRVITPLIDPISESEILEFERIWGGISETLDLDESYSLEDKMIIVTPSVTTRASGAENESCVIMSDSVLMSPSGVSQNTSELLSSIIPFAEEKRNLKLCFVEYLCYTDFFNRYYERDLPAYDLLKFHTENERDDVRDEEGIERYNASTDAMYSLLAYKLDTLGEQYVLQKTYEYLTDVTTTQDEVDFLYNLEQEE